VDETRTAAHLSVLVADNLQRMGYANILSMDGGIRVWRGKGLPLTTG
jgi:rhodanese-related sulfurtransferase